MNRILNFFINLCFSVLIAYIIYSAIFGERGFKNYLKMKNERIRLEKQLTKTISERDRLSEELALMQRDPLFLKEQIRIKIQKGKKGEVFYIFPENDGEVNDTHNR